MQNNQSNHYTDNQAFTLKMRSLTLPVLHLQTSDLEVIETQLKTLKEKTPNIFQFSPIMIDMEAVKTSGSVVDLERLCQILRQCEMIPVGVQGADKCDETPIRKAGLSLFPISKRQTAVKLEIADLKKTISADPKYNKASMLNNASRLVTKPVRSGQQIYAEGGDLVVLAPVSHGAELLADGNIHVYGPLRGRALAGLKGDIQSRIFCQNLEAELLSIAGQYMISEAIEKYKKEGFQQIYLEAGKLQIAAL